MALQIIVKNSSVSGNEPTAGQLANGELALNYHADGPFITCKDTAGVVRRVTGVWVNATAPGSPMPGEFWFDLSVSPPQLRVYKDSGDAWVAAATVYAATTSVAGVIELATNAETQTGTETNRAVTPASLQSKLNAITGDITFNASDVTSIAAGVIVNADINASAAIAGSKIVAATTSVVGAVQLSDSTSTTSSVLAATPTAVKAAYDLADAALPKAGGTLTGNVILDNQVDARFREATANGTNYVGFQAPATIAADVLWTLPAVDGTAGQVISTNGTGTLSFATAATGDVTLTGTQTLTNKTLTSPILTTPALGTPASGTLTNCTFPTLNQSTTGNASTATTLATARNIQGVSFDGSAAITVVTAGSGISVTGTAVANTGVLSVNGSTGAITNIAATNAVQSFTAAQRGTISALTDGATITADFAVANNFSVTLGGNRTLANPSNQTAGQSGCIWITQDGTGSRTLAYGSQWDFTGGTAPTLSTTAAAVDCLVYAVQSSTKITATLITNLS